MKKPEKIKKGLECAELVRCPNKECPYYMSEKPCVSQVQKDALAYIQQLESTYSQLSKALCGKDSATLEEILAAVDQLKPRWISVEERLPENGEKVIVRGMRDGIQTGTYKGHSTVGKRVWWWKHNTYLKVAYWMPESMLPEAPKEDVQ